MQVMEGNEIRLLNAGASTEEKEVLLVAMKGEKDDRLGKERALR